MSLSVAKKVGGIFDSMSDDDDFFTPSITVKSVPKTTPPKKELSESDKKALRYSVHHAHVWMHLAYHIAGYFSGHKLLLINILLVFIFVVWKILYCRAKLGRTNFLVLAFH